MKGVASEPLQVPGIEIEREIGRGAHSVVYSGRRDGRVVAVKVQKAVEPDPEARTAALLRFQREAAVLACLRHPGLPAILEIGESAGRPYIIREFVAGLTLAEMITSGPLSEDATLALARRVAGALGEVHARGMVHCDVKPANILIDPVEGARLIDFGFAVRAAHQQREGVVGTLLYAAPEQTGMLKRPLDGRSDLYGLGAVLYEALSGSPPFQHGDTGELIRLHAVAPPPELRKRRPTVSPGLAAIVHKLLAKEPDERYQSAGELTDDLQRLAEINRRIEEGRGPGLGTGHRPASRVGGRPLFGREGERTQLLRLWDRVRRGTGAVILIEGEKGIGKSHLCDAIQRELRTEGGVLTGRCTPGAPLPFASLREALDGFAARVRLLPPEERAHATAQLRESAGEGSSLLLALVPGLTGILEEPATRGGPTAETQVYDAVASFLLGLARCQRRLALVIEDIQWLDEATRQVLGFLAARVREAPILLVVSASSDREARPALERFVLEMGSALTRLPLPPLDETALALLIASELGSTAPPEFAQRLAARSGGNPLTAIELTRGMLDSGLLRPHWGGWLADLDGLQRLNLPSDVVHLLRRRLDAVSAPARAILRAAAVVGHRFDPGLLARVSERPGEVEPAMIEALRANVLEWEGVESLCFVHAELRVALLEELSADDRAALHQRIAEALGAGDLSDPARIYQIARHYAEGTARDPRRGFESAFAAGRLALDQHAYEEAFSFLSRAGRIAAEATIELPPDFETTLGEVAAKTGRFADAIQHLERALAASGDRLRRAQLRSRLAYVHTANFRAAPAVESVQAGFRELGIPWPRWRPLQILITLLAWLRAILAGWLGWGRRALREDRRARYATYVKLCEYGAIAHYMNSQPLDLLQMVLRPRFAALRLGGRSSTFALNLTQHAVAYAVIGLRGLADRTIGRARRLAASAGDRVVEAQCRLYHGFVIHLCGRSVEAEAMARRTLSDHGSWMDSLHYVYASGDLVYNLLLRGYYREAWSQIDRMLPRSWFTTSGGVRSRQVNPWAAPVLAGLGRTTEALEYKDHFAETVREDPPEERFRRGEYLSYRVLFHLEQGELGAPLEEAIADLSRLGLRPRTTSFQFRSFFLTHAHARLEQAMRAARAGEQPALAPLRRALRELRQSSMIPATDAHALVIAAGLRRLEQRPRESERLLDRAEAIAARVDSPWISYEVARQRAHLLRGLGREAPALRAARSALALALEHGLVYRARRVRAEFDLAEAATRPFSSSGSSSPMREAHSGPLRIRRQLDALLQVSLAAANVLDPDQHARVALDEIVKILGAERGYLFRITEGEELRFQVGRDAGGGDLAAPVGFSTTVVETVRAERRAIVLAGAEEGAAIGAQSVITHDLKSVVAAPVMMRERLVGVLYLDSRLARGVFTEEDVEILQAIGNHIAVALETARAAQLEIQYAAEEQKRRLAESLREMSHALSATLNLDEVLRRLLEGVTRVVPSDRASIYLLAGDELRRVFSRTTDGTIAATSEQAVPLSDDPYLTQVVAERRPLRFGEGAPGRHLRAWLGVPLISHERVAGAVVLESLRPNLYTQDLAEMSFAFASQAGVAIENARLFGEVERLATTDGLTGTLSRRHFFTLAEHEFARARRYGGPLCAMMIDVDHFKRVNDGFGHAVGDQVLQAIAGICAQSIREVDLLGRYGGEEFALVLPGTRLPQAKEVVAERLRRLVEEHVVPAASGEVRVTISIGVAECDASTVTLATLLDRADAALYAAKRAGRNRVLDAGSVPPAGDPE